MLSKKTGLGLFVALLIAGFVTGYFYFLVLGYVPFAEPEEKAATLEKPAIPGSGEIDIGHVIFLLEYIGAGKLHKMPVTGELPVIEVYISDAMKLFRVEVDDNMLRESKAGQPDIRLNSTTMAISGIFESIDPVHKISQAIASGDIRLEVLRSEGVLALKGYKIIYDRIVSRDNSITSEVILLDPRELSRGISLVLVAIFTIMFGIIVERIF